MSSLCHACLRRLKKQETDFCAICRQELFDGAPVTATLNFALPTRATMAEAEKYREMTRQISISGVQEKFSVRLAANLHLELTTQGGQYLLKPVSKADFQHVDAIPANEHLTMQLARQVFKLPTAACAILRFSDAIPAYLTRRFDVLADGRRAGQEDFAQIAGRTEDVHGPNYKYDFSHEAIAHLIRRHLPAAYLPEATIYFRLTLFNYLVANGDAHLKNFSLYRLPSGEYRLTPAYDLLSTALHVNDGNGLALDLFAEDYETESFRANAFLAYDDFMEFGRRIGLPLSRVKKLLTDIVGHEAKIQQLIDRSFLPAELQTRYAQVLADRRQRLRYSFAASS